MGMRNEKEGEGEGNSYDICTYVHLNSLRRLAFTFFTAFFRLSFLTLSLSLFLSGFLCRFWL